MADLHIAQPLTLACGLTLPNRIVKASMAESWAASTKQLPGPQFHSAYDAWSEGEWGMLLTGNVQVDSRFLGTPGDLAFNESVDYKEMLNVWKAWAQSCSRSGAPAIVQINHPGRQSPIGAGTKGYFQKNLAPSAVPLNFGSGLLPRFITSLVFGTPAEMTLEDIQFVIKRFVDTARLAAEAGFAGIQVHAAHGYLLAQFLSDKTNKRTDAFGGSAKARAKIVVDIIEGVRAAVPKNFCVGLKMNSVDHQSPEELKACLEQLKLIDAARIDFLEISGGTYEDPTMNLGVNKAQTNATPSARTKAREAFFIEFAEAIRQDLPDVPLMVTGGFRTRAGMEAALEDKHCDLVGLARPAVIRPALPKEVLLNTQVKTTDAVLATGKYRQSFFAKMTGLKPVGAGEETTWYSSQIRRIGKL